ncbi:MAG TPA: hypothetical protein VM013_07255 [Dehalococcoidia bacterium]|nr:hypothetical protein [Dehalococcoidia bacterium]
MLRDLSRGHVSREIAKILKPVIAALESIDPSIAVPLAAQKALEESPKRILRTAAA